jgi:hypothetical protein
VYERFAVILGLALVILMLGFALLYRKQGPETPAGAPGRRKA